MSDFDYCMYGSKKAISVDNINKLKLLYENLKSKFEFITEIIYCANDDIYPYEIKYEIYINDSLFILELFTAKLNKDEIELKVNKYILVFFSINNMPYTFKTKFKYEKDIV